MSKFSVFVWTVFGVMVGLGVGWLFDTWVGSDFMYVCAFIYGLFCLLGAWFSSSEERVKSFVSYFEEDDEDEIKNQYRSHSRGGLV